MANVNITKIETLSDHCYLGYNKIQKTWKMYDKTKTSNDNTQVLFQDVNSSRPQGSLNSYRNKKLNDTFKIVNLELSIVRTPQFVKIGKAILNSEVYQKGDSLTGPATEPLKFIDEELYDNFEKFIGRFITLSLLVSSKDLYNSDMAAIKTMNKTDIDWTQTEMIEFKVSVDNFLNNNYKLEDTKAIVGAIAGDGTTTVDGVITKSFDCQNDEVIYFPVMLKLFGYNQISLGQTK